MFFFFNDTATTEIYTLSLHDALPISRFVRAVETSDTTALRDLALSRAEFAYLYYPESPLSRRPYEEPPDRKSTRLNSSHANISYAVFCLKKKINLYFTQYAGDCDRRP